LSVMYKLMFLLIGYHAKCEATYLSKYYDG
jgi:hypothetical protein